MSDPQSIVAGTFRALLPIAILAAGVLGFAAMAGLREAPPPVERRAVVPRVTVSPVGYYEGRLELTADGVVTPHREIRLSAEVSGRITQKSPACKAGRRVAQGTLLLEIDPRQYELEANRLQQELEQAESSLEELAVESENTQRLVTLAEQEVALRTREVARATDLRRRNVGTAAQLDEATRLELTARNSLTTLSNQLRMQAAARRRLASAVDSAKVRWEQARLDLSKSQVRAPIDGVVVAESVEQDSYVQAGAELLTLEDVSAVEIRSNLRLEQLDWVLRQPTAAYPGASENDDAFELPPTPATVSFNLGGREYRWEGRLWRYEGIGVEERTRTVPVRILVEEPRLVAGAADRDAARAARAMTLVRGMFVQLTLHVEPEESLLVVPSAAVQPGDSVWCVREGQLHQVQLHNVVAVPEGVAAPRKANELRPDDLVVTSPLAAPSEGSAVEVVPANPEEPAASAS